MSPHPAELVAPAPGAAADAPSARALRAQGWVLAGEPGWGELAREALALPAGVWRRRELVATALRRELRARLAGTLLGRLWPLLVPAAQCALYYLVFAQLLGFRMPGGAGGEALFGAWLLSGVLVWGSFAASVQRSAHAFLDGATLLRKVAYPAELLPLNVALVELSTLLYGVAAFLVVTAAVPAWPTPTLALLGLPAVVAVHALLASAAGLLVATLQVAVRDTAHALGVLLQVAMLATPVVWVPSPEVLPLLAEHPWLVEANPLHHLLQAWRWVLLDGEPQALLGGSPARSLAQVALWALALHALASLLFVSCRRRLADEV